MADAAFVTDRCMAVIDGNFMVPRCGLKLGHAGPHEPIKVGVQTVSTTPLWWRVYRAVARVLHGRQWPMSTAPIPPEDVKRAARLAQERGWDRV